MPEEQVAREGETRQNRGPREGAPGRARGRTLLLESPSRHRRPAGTARRARRRWRRDPHRRRRSARRSARCPWRRRRRTRPRRPARRLIPVGRSSASRTWEEFRRTRAGAGQGCPVALSVVVGHVKALSQPLPSAPSPIMSAPLARPRPDLSLRPSVGSPLVEPWPLERIDGEVDIRRAAAVRPCLQRGAAGSGGSRSAGSRIRASHRV